VIKTAAQILAEVGVEDPPKRLGRPPLHKTCTMPHCTAKHKAHGLCDRHRWINNRWGDPMHTWVRPRPDSGLECACPVHTP
jgi:hypothetical protein